ncbi:MAG: aminoacyl-tRNA hydrolase [bacterium]
MTWFICGLGNKGKRYSRTRHNIGFIVVDAFARKIGTNFASSLFTIGKAYTKAEGMYRGERVLIIKPLTYMNLSGIAIKEVLKKEDIQFDKMLIIMDDFNIPFGKMRLRKKGSAGGHKGLSSIIDYIKKNDIPRLRIGIGPVPDEIDPIYFVLSPFSERELDMLDGIVNRAVECVEFVIENGYDKAIARFNT